MLQGLTMFTKGVTTTVAQGYNKSSASPVKQSYRPSQDTLELSKQSAEVHFGNRKKKDKKTQGEKFFASVAGNAASGFVKAKTGKPLNAQSKEKVGDAWTNFSREVDRVGGPVMDAIFDPIFGKRKKR